MELLLSHLPTICWEGERYYLSSDVPNYFLCQCPLPFLTCQGEMEHFQPPEYEGSDVLKCLNNEHNFYRLNMRNLLQEIERLAFIAKL